MPDNVLGKIGQTLVIGHGIEETGEIDGLARLMKIPLVVGEAGEGRDRRGEEA